MLDESSFLREDVVIFMTSYILHKFFATELNTFGDIEAAKQKQS